MSNSSIAERTVPAWAQALPLAVVFAVFFIAPLLLGDEQAQDAVRGLTADRLTDGIRLRLIDSRVRGNDIMARYRVDSPPGVAMAAG